MPRGIYPRTPKPKKPKKRYRDTPSERPEALVSRQREHRLRERVQPIEPVPSTADPWLIAAEALDHLEAVLGRKGTHYVQRSGYSFEEHVSEAMERISELAWGPESLEDSG